MKCPKCSYISVDYNNTCPKCSRDLTDERESLGLPDYKPDPPSLLGDLLGEISPSAMPGVSGTSSQLDPGLEHDLSMPLTSQDVTKTEGAQALAVELSDLDLLPSQRGPFPLDSSKEGFPQRDELEDLLLSIEELTQDSPPSPVRANGKAPSKQEADLASFLDLPNGPVSAGGRPKAGGEGDELGLDLDILASLVKEDEKKKASPLPNKYDEGEEMALDLEALGIKLEMDED